MTTLKERRTTDRERQRRWRERQKQQGNKTITANISLKAQVLLKREKKKTGESTSAVVERAILNLQQNQA